MKPYVVMILDTSGSMDAATTAGPPSCGGTNTRLNHAKCAINKIVNSYGDMVFALSRFRETPGGTFMNSCDANGNVSGGGADDCTTSGVSCNNCNCDGSDTNCTTDPDCTASMRSDTRLEMLTGLVDGNNDLAGNLTNGACGTCTLPAVGNAPASNQEIWGTGSWTPLGGSLLGAHRYWQGLQATDGTVMWPSGFAGFDPIRSDVTKTSFLPKPGANSALCNPNPATCTATVGCTGANCCCAEQCRPYITILLTDGDETCGGDAPTAATALLNNTVIDNRQYRIETKVIGFGINPGDADIEQIAQAGSLTGDIPAQDEGYYAADEAELQLAISAILADAIKTETCNNLDDDCDVLVDEDFPGKAAACSNGRLGKCRVNGANVCRVDGTGLQCDAGQSVCAALADGAACNVVNAAGATVAGLCQTGANGRVCQPTAAASEPPFGCNNIDDDCDGRIDEGVAGCTCVPSTEICDGMNNDCDGATDEGTDVPCGTGTCLGVRPCNGAAGLGACTADTPTDEICNGVDDNCDGNADGFQEACSNMTCPGGSCTGGPAGQRTCVGGTRAGKRCDTFPQFDARNNPGGNVGSPCDLLGAQCVCNPGNRTCPLNGAGVFSACVQEVEPGTEICNDLDDDCDGMVDETPTSTCTTSADCPPITPSCDNGTCQPADCSVNNCGGQLLCVSGAPMCTQTSGVDDTCNGLDEDCDGNFDEGWACTDPDGADNIPGNADDCPCTSGGMCNTHESCENGAVICQGTPTSVEACDCEDDDCDTIVDEGTCGAGSGPPGSSCKGCQCAFPCQGGEFPCPLGKRCVTLPGDSQGFCLADPCFGVTCDPVGGNKQVCRTRADNLADYECVSACDPAVINCGSSNICFGPTGECRPDDCSTFPDRCTAQQNCINGECVTNLCNGVTCPADQYCVAGQCYGSCANVECPSGQRCRLGACVADPCGDGCPGGQVCHDETGECVADPCRVVECPQGQWCNPNNNGSCEDDPCVGTACPNDGELCRGGTCYDPSVFAPDASVEQYVTTGGGGGCSTGGGGSTAALALGLAAMLMRRRTKGGAS